MRIVVGAMGPGRVALVDPSVSLEPFETVTMQEFPAVVRALESRHPRWVWADTRRWYPRLLAEGVRVDRCHDLVLAAALIDHSTTTASARDGGAHPRPAWLPAGPAEAGQAGAVVPVASAAHAALFDLGDFDGETQAPEAAVTDRPRDVRSVPIDAVLAEHARQLALVTASERPGALRLLVAAESAGALIGAELHAAGLPWHRGVHERVLEGELGPKPSPGRKPARMEQLAAEVRALLGAPAVNLDSQVDLLKALRRAGIQVESTSRWELREHEHPAIEPLVAYKKLARLFSANAWSWLDEWVVDGRFRPDYVPGGTATGRWATSGGGALQLPKNVRSAVVADPGWSLVVADAAQLEPRVLAGLARDEAMAEAGRGRDFYGGIVGAGVVETRDQAKVAILGAMYGATTGESGRLVPRLARAYPSAMALVDRAAADGERGASVTTLLGRSSPPPGVEWRAAQSRASQPEATAADERRARSGARDWGRFTRNFVVQGTAAEWALCWMAGLRSRLMAIAGDAAVPEQLAHRSGPVFERMPHLVYYLHDEIIVHTPRERADEVAAAVADAANEAGRLLFGAFPVEFPLDLAIVESYALADA
ncbi:bifunctional 3'-5' exonuclease/DNA polymerase [Agromyces badenianii]|uniref:bifunctional 3'-5' exonuclease/DNA polymerase n=1 Tax=Agromyces badenianii TaxID=2080742 RepID=UPI000D597370|nr:bifunctional 3'-5' exonuclease/DNA polymerase [Agromyces badenianii]PWC04285.1 bifunctional 3'-5' exonuclease/DNA polymerase [Agromyces badenianii]